MLVTARARLCGLSALLNSAFQRSPIDSVSCYPRLRWRATTSSNIVLHIALSSLCYVLDSGVSIRRVSARYSSKFYLLPFLFDLVIVPDLTNPSQATVEWRTQRPKTELDGGVLRSNGGNWL